MSDYDKLLAFVKKVATAPEGRWSNDPQTYLHNVITDTMEEARALLKEVKSCD